MSFKCVGVRVFDGLGRRDILPEARAKGKTLLERRAGCQAFPAREIIVLATPVDLINFA
jgi:hypothetical protein